MPSPKEPLDAGTVRPTQPVSKADQMRAELQKIIDMIPENKEDSIE